MGELTGGRVVGWDLVCPLDARADWVLSLEVAEHIPRSHEAAFVSNVVRNARCGVLLSWGKPGQEGAGHVNLREPAYVSELMGKESFAEDASLTQQLRAAAKFFWLRENVRAFRRLNADAACV